MPGLDDARTALTRGRPVVLITPPAVEQAGSLWPLLDAPTLIVCESDEAATAWVTGAPADHPVHAATGLARTAALLKTGVVATLAGTPAALAALVTRSALQPATFRTIVLAWPERLVEGDQAPLLESVLSEASEAQRIVLTWNPAALRDFLERHARRAEVVGSVPGDASWAGAALPPAGPARYAIVPGSRRAWAVREATDTLACTNPLVWTGQSIDDSVKPDLVICDALPTRDELISLLKLGPVVLLLQPEQLPYARSIATLAPLGGQAATDRATDRAETLRARIAERLEAGAVDAEVSLLAPLFERYDPAEVAGALLSLTSQSTANPGLTPGDNPEPGWVRVFVNVGKKDNAAAKDLVGALTRELNVPREAIGRIDVRETSCMIEVAPAVADRAIRGLSGTTIRGRRVIARPDRDR